MNVTILSCSLDPDSDSRRLAHASAAILAARGHEPTLIDLRELGGVPPFDNDHAYDDPRCALIHDAIARSDGVVIASPVYNWGLSAAAKSLIELTGATTDTRRSAWFDRLVTFVCAGGLPHSYMAFGSSAISLMLDFKCVVNPYLVYAAERDWTDDGEPGDRLLARLQRALAVKMELAALLAARTYRSEWDV